MICEFVNYFLRCSSALDLSVHKVVSFHRFFWKVSIDGKYWVSIVNLALWSLGKNQACNHTHLAWTTTFSLTLAPMLADPQVIRWPTPHLSSQQDNFFPLQAPVPEEKKPFWELVFHVTLMPLGAAETQEWHISVVLSVWVTHPHLGRDTRKCNRFHPHHHCISNSCCLQKQPLFFIWYDFSSVLRFCHIKSSPHYVRKIKQIFSGRFFSLLWGPGMPFILQDLVLLLFHFYIGFSVYLTLFFLVSRKIVAFLYDFGTKRIKKNLELSYCTPTIALNNPSNEVLIELYAMSDVLNIMKDEELFSNSHHKWA